VELLEERYYNWEYSALAKKKGGKVCIFMADSGEVEVKRGIVSNQELRKLEKQAATDENGITETQTNEKPEITKKLNEYLLGYLTQASHTAITHDYELTQRVLLVMLLNNDRNVGIGQCEQFARVNGEIANEELFASRPHQESEAFTSQALKRAGTSPAESSYSRDFDKIFKKVMKLPIEEVQAAIQATVVSLISLTSQTVTALHRATKPEMSAFWNATDNPAFFDAISSKPLLLSLLESLTDKKTAGEHANSKVKDLRELVRTRASETENWIPAYFSGGKYGNGVGRPLG